VNSAEMRGAGIRWQRVELYLGLEPSRGQKVIGLLARPEPADLPAAERDEDDRERDRDYTENRFAKGHA
jgi:hypothetical protein